MPELEPAAGDSAAPSLAPRLLAALRARRTYLAIYQHYRKASPKADFAALLDQLVDDTQDSLATLSHHLRLLDRNPLSAGVNETLLTQGMLRKGTPSKLNFLLVGTANSLEWVANQQSPDDPPAIQALWHDLHEMELQHQQAIKALLGQLQPTRESQPPPPLP